MTWTIFNIFLGVVALIVSGLIGATITYFLMGLGIPKEEKIKPRPLWKNDHNK
jgi:hypothetical protein|tara:strand:- start:39 stop:197 length:159 start_codon:yes stop_codon:yes gene_type:complete